MIKERERCRNILYAILKKYAAESEFANIIKGDRQEYRTFDSYSKIIAEFTYRMPRPRNWVDEAGHWGASPSGHNFWSRLNNEYRECVDNSSSINKVGCKSIW